MNNSKSTLDSLEDDLENGLYLTNYKLRKNNRKVRGRYDDFHEIPLDEEKVTCCDKFSKYNLLSDKLDSNKSDKKSRYVCSNLCVIM